MELGRWHAKWALCFGVRLPIGRAGERAALRGVEGELGMIYHGAGERGLEHGAEGGGVWEGPLWHGLGRATVLPPVRAALSGHRPWVALESLLGVSSLEEARRQPCPTFFSPWLTLRTEMRSEGVGDGDPPGRNLSLLVPSSCPRVPRVNTWWGVSGPQRASGDTASLQWSWESS